MADQYQNGYQPAYQPQPQYPPQYRQPSYPQPYVDPTTQVMTVGQYLGVFFISMIPVVNFICWIVWLASSNTNKNKKNYIIANIVFTIIVFVVYGIIFAILISAGVLAGTEFAQYFT